MNPPNDPPISPPRVRFVKLSLAAVQVFDLALHLAIGQAEPLRIAANLIILAWLAAPATGRWLSNARLLAVAALAIYLSLNFIFLAEAGVTNPNEGGGLRLALFALVLITTVLSALLIYWRSQTQHK